MFRYSMGFIVVFAACTMDARLRAEDVGLDLFERKIRPVITEHCLKCHADDLKKRKGGLSLESKASLRKGGDTGPALVPGKPKESLLVKALHYTDPDLQMPPVGKLPASVIADFEQWIALGAPDPREGKVAKTSGNAESHWAFQPIRKPPIPSVDGKGVTPIDAFLLAKLRDKNLPFSPQADRRTLIRRVTFDLIGLPPTLAEVEAFEKDTAPDAFAKVVDRLLASPRYGERWARHWLDVARYADTKDGVLMYDDGRIRPYAYTYRDYVIKAFNQDLPFDDFVRDQLAADLSAPKDQPWRLGAMGFLTLGRMFDNNVHDVIDDRIDVTSRGFMGLTVTCARCHEHKSDPITMRDYYALYGVFANSEAPLELPLTEVPEKIAGFNEFEKQAAPQRFALRKMVDEQYASLSEIARQRVGDYLVHVATTKPDPLETAIFFMSLQPEDLRPQIVARWRRYLHLPDRADDPIFGPLHAIVKLSDEEFTKESERIVKAWTTRPPGLAAGQVHPAVREKLATSKFASKKEFAQAFAELFRQSYAAFKKAPNSMDDATRALAEVVTRKESPAYFSKSQTYYYMNRGEKDAYGGKVGQLDMLAVKSPTAPPRAMVLVDAQEPFTPRMFLRGNPATPGEIVPRGFLKALSENKSATFGPGSGRLDLANAIASRTNPLTARVFVNRIWMHHFGEPLVSSPSDFGLRANPPSHPELLDWVAAEFMEQGWSLKKLHRTLVLTQAYQQSSADRVEGRTADTENRLLWRAHRRRLDFESMRDNYLTLAGRLDTTMFGRPVDIVKNANNPRRSIYGLVDRQSLPNVFRIFDFAVPDQSVERRPRTTVPQQALFAMNSEFLTEQAKALLARPEVNSAKTDEEKIGSLYRLVVQRSPQPTEIAAGIRFLTHALKSSGSSDRSQLSNWQQYAQVLLLTNEVMFVD